jgi:hypothetical protein
MVRDRLEIHAANGRDLRHINLSAPRLLRPMSGEFAVQTACVPVSNEKPAIGGLRSRPYPGGGGEGVDSLAC